jgi:hypothetical protein
VFIRLIPVIMGSLKLASPATALTGYIIIYTVIITFLGFKVRMLNIFIEICRLKTLIFVRTWTVLGMKALVKVMRFFFKSFILLVL